MRRTILGIGVLSVTGLTSLAHVICSPVAVAGEGQMIYHQYQTMWHKDVGLPLRNLALEIRARTDSLLDAILEGDYESVKKNAQAISEKGQQVINTYFPQSLDIEAFKTDPKTSHLPPDALEKFKQLRADFLEYFNKIDPGLQEIQKAAESKNEAAAFDAFSTLIKSTCIDCHNKYR